SGSRNTNPTRSRFSPKLHLLKPISIVCIQRTVTDYRLEIPNPKKLRPKTSVIIYQTERTPTTLLIDMAVEESQKQVTAEEVVANANPKSQSDDDVLEEGEIVGGGDDDSTKKSAAVPHEPHMLEHQWTFWFDNPSAKSKQSTWGSSMRSIFTFSTVEEFWSLYNNIHHPTKLAVGADFYCFKHNIEPKWEDPICANGGRWMITYQRGKSDTPWLYTLLAMIGEQFEHGDEICGAVVNVRGRQERVSIWTKNAANEAAQLSIGRQWKEFVDHNDSIGFIVHVSTRLSFL
ncbi:Eukaryotic translation initiation factor 4E-1, partial [Linum grandiflorum]